MYTDSELLLLFLLITAVLTFCTEWMARRKNIPYWLSRKILHISAISICAVAPLLVKDTSLLINLVVFCEILLAFLVYKGILFKDEDGRKSWGIALFPLAYLLLLFVYREHIPIVFFSMALLAICDAFAAITGTFLRKFKPTLQVSDKTTAGNTGFIASGIVLFFLFEYYYPELTPRFSQFVFILFLLMLTEHLGKKGADNFFIPLLAAILLSAHLPYACTMTPLFIYTTLLVTVLMMAVIYRKNILTQRGVYTAAFFGLSIVYFNGFAPTLPILFFFLSSTLLGRLSKNKNASSDKKSGGARDEVQVWVNGGIYTTLLISSSFFQSDLLTLIACISIAISTADTWSSEAGMALRGKTYDILRRKKVPSGVSGGVSISGTLAGLAGALAASYTAYIVFKMNDISSLYTIAAYGFAGMLTDSFLGAWIQVKFLNEKTLDWSDQAQGPYDKTKGLLFINNDMVNLLSNLIICCLYLLLSRN